MTMEKSCAPNTVTDDCNLSRLDSSYQHSLTRSYQLPTSEAT
jgi:hypothetical protein